MTGGAILIGLSAPKLLEAAEIVNRSCTATDHKGQSRVNAPVEGRRALTERASGWDRRGTSSLIVYIPKRISTCIDVVPVATIA